jgi:hypothetical protein
MPIAAKVTTRHAPLQWCKCHRDDFLRTLLRDRIEMAIALGAQNKRPGRARPVSLPVAGSRSPAVLFSVTLFRLFRS